MLLGRFVQGRCLLTRNLLFREYYTQLYLCTYVEEQRGGGVCEKIDILCIVHTARVGLVRLCVFLYANNTIFTRAKSFQIKSSNCQSRQLRNSVALFSTVECTIYMYVHCTVLYFQLLC